MEMTKTTLFMSFIIAMVTISTQQKHFMLALMCLEMMVLTMFTMMVIFSSTSMSISQIFMPTILLTISVCGAAVGLSLVVAITRTHGNDFLKNLSLL